MKTAASSVAVTLKSFAVPSASMAAMPAGMEAWRNPAVLEKTSTSKRPSPTGGAASASTWPVEEAGSSCGRHVPAGGVGRGRRGADQEPGPEGAGGDDGGQRRPPAKA